MRSKCLKSSSRILWSSLILMVSNALTVEPQAVGWSGRIVDGKNVTPVNKYPMMLRLGTVIEGHSETYCGGTILNKRWGLTAAHCVGNRGSQAIYRFALAGLYYDGKPDPAYVQNVTITNITIHYAYRKAFEGNDIAVFRVSPPFAFNDRVTPTNLAPCDWNVRRDKEEITTAVGWGAGRNESENYPPDNPLQEVDLPLRTTGACQRAWLNFTITDHQVCAGGVDGSGACFGDSGGPLFVYDEEVDIHIQVGITSFGDPLCGQVDKRPPAVWTKVSKYIGWIEEVTRECDRARYLPIGPLE